MRWLMKLQDWLRSRLHMEPLTEAEMRRTRERGDRLERRVEETERKADDACRAWRKCQETLPPEPVVPNGNGGK